MSATIAFCMGWVAGLSYMFFFWLFLWRKDLFT